MVTENKYEITLTPEEFAFQNGIVNPETRAIAREKLEESYNNIINILKEYVEMPEDYYKFIALWLTGTYFHDKFITFPMLFFNAMRGSGKSRTLSLIAHLGSKGDGKIINNLTEAVLFRIPKGTTTCIDEIEQIGSKEKQTLRELLNAAYKKGSKVVRMKKVKLKNEEAQVTETFEPFIPLAMANIWGLEEVLADRAITLILEKSSNPLFIKKVENFDDDERFALIKKTLKQCSLCSVVSEKNISKEWNFYITTKYTNTLDYTTTYTTTTTHNYTTTNNNNTNFIIDLEREDFFRKIDDSGIDGRNFELIFPLLLVAKEIGDGYFDEALRICKELTMQKKEDEYTESRDVSFIDFISIQDSFRFQYIPVKEIASKFRTFLGEQDNEDRWINDKWVGKALKRLKLVDGKKRVASGIIVLVKVDKAKEKIKFFKSACNEEGKA